MKQIPGGETRRDFITQTTLATTVLAAGGPASWLPAEASPVATTANSPWSRRTLRWGQTNITELDPTRYDIGWWRQHWKQTHTQGVIINAGGIVAYYPSRVPLHRPAEHLGGRDLFGELCRAAHDEGLVVFARMDSNRAHEAFYRAHPDWFALDAEGRPYRAGELFVTCVNGPYYEEHIPAILREIAERYHPEGFTDNSWSGLGRGSVCYCDNCRRKFRERSGEDIPRAKDWNDPAYREWIRWNYDRRLEIWDLNNRTAKAAGGPECLWSQQNTDFYGRDDADLHVEMTWRGMTQALIRARIPYLPIHADHIARDAAQFSILVLPNLGAMSDAQVDAVRRFVARGGGLLATGESSQFTEWGDPRPDFALADLLGAHVSEPHGIPDDSRRRRNATDTVHTYLRLKPERRARVDGPQVGTEPRIAGERHGVLRGFEDTDILPFGGVLEPVRLDPGTDVLLTFVPAFPIYPPETAWMREPTTDIPGLILRTTAGGSRIAFLPADLDRRFARDNLPDHGDLLAGLMRWVAKDSIPLTVHGPGLIDCHLYRQPGRVILHLVNLTSAGSWRQPVHELIPVGPLRVEVRLPSDVRGKRARLLVDGKPITTATSGGRCSVEIESLLDHQVILIG